MIIEHLRIPYGKIRQISKTDKAYIELVPALEPFIKHRASIEGFEQVIEDKSRQPLDRRLLVNVLNTQYKQLKTSDIASKQIASLMSERTFTVTTAHQPCLFTGPLYFIYKIISTINLARDLIRKYPSFHFVPVFVIGGEDHDFEEVSHARIFGKEIRWEQQGQKGAVGNMQTDTLSDVLDALKAIVGTSNNAQHIYQLIESSYTSVKDFAGATQALIHALFSEKGLVVLNMNHPELKRAFIPIIKDELWHEKSKILVEETQAAIANAGFTPQAYSRAINLFYLTERMRERIIRDEAGNFRVNNTDIVFDEAAMMAELASHPERFSPNVILRPLYQELILPNLAYVGGGGEIAYWLERKSLFEHYQIAFPMLVRRNSVLWIERAIYQKIQKSGLEITDLFEKPAVLEQKILQQQATSSFHLESEKEQLNAVFMQIAEKAASVDPTLEKYALAESAKLLKGIEGVEDRLRKTEKQKHETLLGQVSNLQQKLFPADGLQERTDNFIPFYIKYGDDWFETLFAHLHPIGADFDVLIEKEG